jgi:hypothetical protein
MTFLYPSTRLSSAAETLYAKGVVVLDLGFSADRLQAIRADWNATVKTFPEYSWTDSDLQEDRYLDQLVLGGFSALANPSSFHNASVRQLRSSIYPFVLEVARYYRQQAGPAPGEDWNFEMIHDRMMIRPAHATATSESWHRDVAPNAHADDCIFGGWINLDATPQTFSCVLETHRTQGTKKGFATVDKSHAAQLKAASTQIQIPPGHVLLFHESILHEVVAQKKAHRSYRLFLGWRLTRSKTPLIPDIQDRMTRFSVVPLKSGQIPPMYAQLHLINWPEKLEAFSRKIKDVYKEPFCYKSGKRKHQTFHFVRRYLPDLPDSQKRALFEPYTDAERKRYCPSPLSHDH